jgi:S-adenosylmethionine hydrolase
MKRPVVLQTDFGEGSVSVSTMKGVCRIVDPTLEVFDSTHSVRQFDTLSASDALYYVIPFWPAGTVFVSVVDPGVGTSRKSCVALLENGSYIVTPDNGTLTYIKERIGIKQVREIDETTNRYPTTRDVHIFHGRDVYAYTAARLASGVIDYEGVGPEYPVSEIVMAPYVKPVKKEGEVFGMIASASKHFGLVSTNIPFKWLAECNMNYGDKVEIRVEHAGKCVIEEVVPLAKSFGFVPEGCDLIYNSETSTVEIATNRRNMVLDRQLEDGPDWTLRVRKI